MNFFRDGTFSEMELFFYSLYRLYSSFNLAFLQLIPFLSLSFVFSWWFSCSHSLFLRNFTFGLTFNVFCDSYFVILILICLFCKYCFSFLLDPDFFICFLLTSLHKIPFFLWLFWLFYHDYSTMIILP